jgi:hypothetical protein
MTAMTASRIRASRAGGDGGVENIGPQLKLQGQGQPEAELEPHLNEG